LRVNDPQGQAFLETLLYNAKGYAIIAARPRGYADRIW
jgi:hypothetical protein